MEREIDRTGVKVKAIGLGAMPLSIQGRPDPKQAYEVIETFVEGGGNFIDTANVYCLDDHDIGHNERLIADALTRLDRRDDVVVTTKGGLRRPKGEWVVDGDPAHLRKACEKSLSDLRADCIVLYQLHAVDPNFGLLPSLEALVRLQDEGKILHIGLSNIDLDTLTEAIRHAPIASVQNRCNPFEKSDLKNGMIEFCAANSITYMPHSPVGGHYGHVRLSRSDLFHRLSNKYQTSPYCIALGWLLAKGEHILPIPGASKATSIESSLSAMDVKLEPEDVEAIDGLPDQSG